MNRFRMKLSEIEQNEGAGMEELHKDNGDYEGWKKCLNMSMLSGVNMLEYFDAVVRNTVESVMVISPNRIKIKYVGGIEITKSI